MLHPHPLVATDDSEDSPSLIMYIKGTVPILDGDKAEPGETQGFRKGWTPTVGRNLGIRPAGQSPLDVLYIYIGIYICI